MSDIMCIICNEPYDSYYVYDRDRFGCIIGGTK